MKCLLTGANGRLGQELQHLASEFGIEYHPINGRNDCDLSNEDSLNTYIIMQYPHICDVSKVVHCAAYTDVPGAETNKRQVIDANIIATKNVFDRFCKRFGVILVYISTDYVYPGMSGAYKETDKTAPLNFYAFTKLAGEAYAEQKDLVIRTSFKPEKWQYPGAFSDLYTSADYIDIIARKISFLIANDANGTYNVGTERKSIFELAQRRNKDVKTISALDVKNVQMPVDVSMDVSKYEAFYNQIVGGNNGR